MGRPELPSANPSTAESMGAWKKWPHALATVGAVFRWLIALTVIGFWAWLLFKQVSMPLVNHSLPFEAWYGNWRDVLIVSAVFLVFVFGFVWPRGPAEWRNAGMYTAFLVSLFVEMFGIPLTIFLLAPLLDVSPLEFGLNESHLWASLLDWARIMPVPRGVYWVMTLSFALIAIGLALVAVGWAQVYGARYRLVTMGIYRIVRHPQYLGLILVILAFNIQWPTIPTLLMAPVLIVMYMRQARREDKQLERRFGNDFYRYAARVPAFIPRLRLRRVPKPRAERLE